MLLYQIAIAGYATSRVSRLDEILGSDQSFLQV